MEKQLKDKVKTLSSRPGVYQFFNAKGTVLYVGKARNLKKRVSQYFRANLDSAKTQALMAQVVDFTTTITDSENEALLLESNLIKKLKPRYNVLLRDDKSYPYLFLSTKHPFPRLDFHRGAQKRAGQYFGPYPNAGAVRENLAMIQKLFKLRQCNDSFFSHRSRPCLQYQIRRCTAPCVGKVSQEDYAKQVHLAILFLQGKNEAIMNELADKMEHASKGRDYETAAQYRDQIIRLRKLQRKQYITSEHGDVDVLGVAIKRGKVAVAVLFVRGGHVIGHRTFFPNAPADMDAQHVLSEFIPQYYLSPMRGDIVINKIVLSESLPDREWIENALHQALDAKLKITDQRTQPYKKWQSLANTNAAFALSQHLALKDDAALKLSSLQKELKLPNPIERIECFDISHSMGEAPVASCVVYTTEGAANKEYRRFNIRNITPGDDYAAMKQALERRYKRLKEQDAPLPDLIIIDGGRGQLNQAVEALEQVQVSGVILLGIAKGPERKAGKEKLFLSDRDVELQLKPDSDAFHLLQFIRDEAHRFAITAHRGKRKARAMHSSLEDIEGVGAKRRRDLLKYFGGIQEIRKATVDEIAKVPGISLKLAQRIHDSLT